MCVEGQFVQIAARASLHGALSLREQRVTERMCVGNVQRGCYTFAPPMRPKTDKFVFGGRSGDVYSGADK